MSDRADQEGEPALAADLGRALPSRAGPDGRLGPGGHRHAVSPLRPRRPQRGSISTTPASASVVVSPSARPSATSRSSRRMILPERVFGRSGVNSRYFGRAMGPMTSATCSRSSCASSSLVSTPGAHGDEREDGLAADRVVLAHDRGLRHRLVVHERRLDLDGADAVAGDVHDVIDPPEQPEVAVEVALGAVAREVHAREAAPVRRPVALGVAVDAAEHRRPGSLEDEVATLAERHARRPWHRRCPPRCPGTGRSRCPASWR